ncbi:MAG TPA: 4'-phosphopantetheinyl transferase superfamily protein [Bryobacteraceae bacterium]|nr:4'-phosphopantetheinyl transferase superfamily protein [Bryobacteraceae bacterium]
MRSDFSFELSGNDVHIWTLPTGGADDLVARLERVLDAEELNRAARFRFNHLRESFVVSHGALRTLLGRYLNVPPAEVRFVYGSKGKPALALQSNIEFNMTHSGGLAVIALTLDREIGVDVEQIRSMPDRQAIASRFFCAEEAAEILSLPEAERERAFYCCWTRKEAYIKAIGDGLSTPLDEFRVTVQPGEPARFVHIARDTEAAEAWMLHDLRLAPDYAAALAYRDRERPLRLRRIVDVGEFAGRP